jgi:hypothetical protein
MRKLKITKLSRKRRETRFNSLRSAFIRIIRNTSTTVAALKKLKI